MKNILLKFGLDLNSPSLDGDMEDEQLGFHGWFPCGEVDAVHLPTGHPEVIVSVWFDRKHMTTGTLISRENLDRVRALDEKELSRYGVLWSGPLLATVSVPTTLLEIVVASELSSRDPIHDYLTPERVSMVLATWLCPTMRRLVGVLKYEFGQHWLDDFSSWDGLPDSLATYCSSIQLSAWSETRSAYELVKLGTPRIHGICHIASDASFEKFIGKQDWFHLSNGMTDFQEPTMAAKMIDSTNQLRVKGDHRHALLEAITALELTLFERAERALASSSRAAEAIKAFHGSRGKAGGINLAAKVAVFAALLGEGERKHVEDVLKGIKLRNELVHEGTCDVSQLDEVVEAIVRFCAAVAGREYRPIRQNIGNVIAPSTS